MQPISALSSEQAKGLEYVLCDIDDTVTTSGKLSADAYCALWNLHDAGISVIPVTGRPAGWCDLIIREWPVRAVVGENGAFVCYFDGPHLQCFLHPAVTPSASERLRGVLSACQKAVPGCRAAKDQFSRKYDLAIDFNEDPPHLGLDAAEQIRTVCASMGAQAKISSIHVNAWFGDYNKVETTKLFFEDILHEPNYRQKSIFFGDSPNDEPMFSFFPLTCGVANILPFAKMIENLPAFVTEKEGGEGFAQAIDFILKLRNEPH